MNEKIQSQFLDEANGVLYYEIYFKFIHGSELEFSEYQRIERIINLELTKIEFERDKKAD